MNLESKLVSLSLIMVAVFVLSIYQAINGRVEASHLSTELDNLRRETKRLEDEQRSLILEYYTFADYARIRDHALSLGMVEPSVGEGNLFYLLPRSPQSALPQQQKKERVDEND